MAKKTVTRVSLMATILAVLMAGAGIVCLGGPFLPQILTLASIWSPNQTPLPSLQTAEENLTVKTNAEENASEETELFVMGETIKSSGQITVLLIGTDARPGEKSVGNCDSLIMAHIDFGQKRAAFLSIPRDTLIVHPKYGKQKINAIARLGNSWDAVTQTTEDLTGQTLDGYCVTNFAGFKDIIDTLGGITVDVEKNMVYMTGDLQDGVINLKKGIQKLNGSQALQYARFRHDQLGDITRTTRQQTVLKAIAKEMLQAKTIPKLPRLLPQLMKTVQTNISFKTIWSLAGLFRQGESIQMVSQTLPGYFVNEKEANYWMVSADQAKEVTRALFETGTTSEIFVEPSVTGP